MDSFNQIMNQFRTNTITYHLLLERVKKGKSENKDILPFIGAGMTAFAYGTWKDGLLSIARKLDKTNYGIVERDINNFDYLSAADKLEDIFQKPVMGVLFRRIYSDTKVDDCVLKKQPIYLIPQISNGCITTNFDKCIERSFFLNGKPVTVVYPYDTVRLTHSIQNGVSNIVFKIHGDVLSNSENIIFTGKSYREHYSPDSKLVKELVRWINSRDMLFLGASLINDATVEILKNTMSEGMLNFSIYGCLPHEMETTYERLSQLKIAPILYDSSNNHEAMRIVIEQLIMDINS